MPGTKKELAGTFDSLVTRGRQLLPLASKPDKHKFQRSYQAWMALVDTTIEDLGHTARGLLQQLRRDPQRDAFNTGSTELGIEVLKLGKRIAEGQLCAQADVVVDAEVRGAQMPASPDPDRKRMVFLIHGRDQANREAMVAFLRALDLQPLFWEQAVLFAGGGSPHTWEVVKAAFEQTHAAIVLMTPDDMAYLREDLRRSDDEDHECREMGQPRPNVLIEAGSALMRYEDRTILVEVGRLRPISDLGGRHTVRVSDSSQWRHTLKERLLRAGCELDDSSGDWLRAGAFAMPRERRKQAAAPGEGICLSFGGLLESDIPGKYFWFEDEKLKGTVTLHDDQKHSVTNWRGEQKPQYRWDLTASALVLRWVDSQNGFDEILGPGEYRGRSNGELVLLVKEDSLVHHIVGRRSRDHKDGALLRASDHYEVWIIKDGERYWAKNWECLAEFGFHRSDEEVLPDARELRSMKVGGRLHRGEVNTLKELRDLLGVEDASKLT